MKKIILTVLILLATVVVSPTFLAAEDFVIDTKKAHAFIHFRVSHLGFSWVLGRFNRFEGTFHLDEKDTARSSVEVTIDPASVDTNHAERDKHLRSDDFLDVRKFPEASFISTSIELTGKESAIIHGKFTLHGVTRDLDLVASHLGSGDDPWGAFRRGFQATAKFALADYGINYNLGPHSKDVEIFVSIEGVRQ